MNDASRENPPPPPKFAPRAYQNASFLESDDARVIRIMSEFLEPEARFRQAGIRHTIVFFGSARTPPPDVAQKNLEEAEEHARDGGSDPEAAEAALKRAKRDAHMARYYQEAEELAYRLTQWSDGLPREEDRFTICTGGGPGIMEAANRGARRASGTSVGLNIDIRTEQHPNPYISPDLMFQFRYFMMRKFWFTYPARCMVAFPGGMGTLDEVFEILTLMQAERIFRPRPIILYGEEYWKKVVNFSAMAEHGTISESDRAFIHYSDSVEGAFEHITHDLEKYYVGEDTGDVSPAALR